MNLSSRGANWNDIQKALGERHWIISRRDASIRNFGFLVSRKRFVFTIDDDCLPAARPDGTGRRRRGGEIFILFYFVYFFRNNSEIKINLFNQFN